VDVADVVATDVEAELADGLEEREDLDVADRAAHLGDHHVDVVGGQALDAALDLVGDVRDHLHGLAEVVASALGGEHRLVDRAGGGVGVAGEVLVDEPLVVAEVEVGLAAVVGDEHLTVLERVHRAGVDVDVRVELLHGDPQATHLQQSPQREAVRPLPRELATPPVTKMCLEPEAESHIPTYAAAPNPTSVRVRRPFGLVSSKNAHRS
jgi:hypothetical protein